MDAEMKLEEVGPLQQMIRTLLKYTIRHNGYMHQTPECRQTIGEYEEWFQTMKKFSFRKNEEILGEQKQRDPIPKKILTEEWRP